MPAAQRRRLPRGTLSATTLLDAAARILQAGGVDRLTMRALAVEIGADPTSVYRYFRTKDDLLAALTDRLLTEVEPPPADLPAAAQLHHLARSLLAALLRYPGAVGLVTASPFSRSSVRLVEDSLARLRTTGLDPTSAAEAVQAVIAYVIGHAAQAGADEQGFWAELLDAATPAGDYPTLHATADTWRRPADRQFEGGLQLLLADLGTADH